MFPKLRYSINVSSLYCFPSFPSTLRGCSDISIVYPNTLSPGLATIRGPIRDSKATLESQSTVSRVELYNGDIHSHCPSGPAHCLF